MKSGALKPQAYAALVLRSLAALTILSIPSLSVHAGSMWPEGRLFCFAEERWQRWGPYGEIQEDTGTLLHLNGELTPVNQGIWNFRIESSRDGEDFRVQARGIPSRAGRVRFGVGDLELPPPDCTEAIVQELQPSTWYRGAGVQLDRGPTSVQLMGGVLSRRIGRLHPTRSATETGVGGIRLARDWGKHSRWQVDWHRQEAATRGLSGRQVLSGTLVRATSVRGIRWLGQARLARHDGSPGHRASLLSGVRWTAERFAAGIAVRRIAAGFEGIGLRATSRSNEWGTRAQIYLRPTLHSRLTGSADWSEDLKNQSPERPKERRFIGRFALQVSLAQAIYARSHASYRSRSSQDADSLLVDQGVWNGSGEIGWRSARSLAWYRFSRDMLRDPSDRNDEWHGTRHSVHLSHRFHRSWQAQFDLLSDTRRLPSGIWLSRENRGACHLVFEPIQTSQVWLGFARDVQRADEEQFTRNQWEVLGGLEQGLPWDLALRLEGFLFLPAFGGRAESQRWSLRLSRSFSVGSKRESLGGRALEFGTVRGRVFDDRNGNGVYEDGESGLPDQIIRLGSGGEVRTGPDGTYEFREAAVACDWVVYDPRRLPPRYLTPKKPRRKLSLHPGEEATVDFPTSPSAGICGRVLGIGQDGSIEPMPDVLVRIAGTHKDIFTDQAGRFRFHDLEAGVVNVEIVPWSIPDRCVSTGVPRRQIALEPGITSGCDDFILHRQDPPVIQRFRQKSD